MGMSSVRYVNPISLSAVLAILVRLITTSVSVIRGGEIGGKLLPAAALLATGLAGNFWVKD